MTTRREVLQAVVGAVVGIPDVDPLETDLVEIKNSDLLAVLYLKHEISKQQRQQLERAWSNFWKRAGKETPPVPLLALYKENMELKVMSKDDIK